MFDDIKQWLDSLSFVEKEALVTNLKRFTQLKTFLEAKGVIEKDVKTAALLIVIDHPDVSEFLALHKKLTLQGVEVKDQRNKKN